MVRDLLLTLFPIGSKELNAECIYGLIIRRSVAWSLVTAFQILIAVFGLGLIVKGLAKARADSSAKPDVNGTSWKVRMRKTLLPIAAVVVGGPLVMFLVGAACVHFSASARHASVMRRLAAVDSKELLAACRTVMADPVSYRRDPNYRGSDISLDLKDPKMPEAVRMLGPDEVIVRIDEANHLFDRLEIIMGRDVTVAAFAEGKDPKGVSFGKKIIEGLYYAEGKRAYAR
ncbi:MAG: hypothetical protein WA117_00360 [Verrucomicrobiia bacterium]